MLCLNVISAMLILEPEGENKILAFKVGTESFARVDHGKAY